jgi:hypothetical protein
LPWRGDLARIDSDVAMDKRLLVRLARVACATAAAGLLIGQASSNAASVNRHTRKYQVRWPARPNTQKTYRPIFNETRRIRSVHLFIYGIDVPRGFGKADYIVACVHRGPAFLNWDWKQRGSSMSVTISMASGLCDPGPTVAGKLAAVTLRIKTA